MEQEERMYQVPLEMICRHNRTAEVCRAAVEEDGWQLENVPEEVKTPELCRKADENRSAATLSSPGRGTEKRENPVLFPEILCAYRRAGHAAAMPGGARIREHRAAALGGG